MTDSSIENEDKNRFWHLYILNCDGKRFYTGITNDVQRRYNDHLKGNSRGAKFTKTASCIELVYSATIGDKILAAKIEYQVKQLTRLQKARIIEKQMDKRQLMLFLNFNAETINHDVQTQKT